MKNIVFTGALSGIARKVIEKLKKRDYHIYVTVHTEKQKERLEKKYQEDTNITCLKLDITNPIDRKQLEDVTIDILVCNAAVGYGGSIAEIPIERVKETFDVNVISNFEIVQLGMKQMLKRKEGRIIMISSLAAYLPLPFLGVYCASKASISILTKALQTELKLHDTNIDIILVEPGMYHTGFNQVMIENKYDFMEKHSIFQEELEQIKNYETKIYPILEIQNLNSIVKKIVHAITSSHPKPRYRSRISQMIEIKFY